MIRTRPIIANLHGGNRLGAEKLIIPVLPNGCSDAAEMLNRQPPLHAGGCDAAERLIIVGYHDGGRDAAERLIIAGYHDGGRDAAERLIIAGYHPAVATPLRGSSSSATTTSVATC
ncbi:hypothetical protein ACP70R_002534 [Stipagrostis hirtigluma subsp. patula]